MRFSIVLSLFIWCVSLPAFTSANTIKNCLTQENPERCLESLKPSDSIEQGAINIELSRIYLEKGLTDKALENGLIAWNVSKEIEDARLQLQANLTLGETYRRLRDYKKAIYYFNAAKHHSAGDSASLPKIYNSIGLLHSQLLDFELSKTILDSGFVIAQSIGDTFGMARLLTNLGFLHNRFEKYPEAIHYYLKSIELKKTLDNPASLAYSLNDLGEVHSHLGNFNAARSYSKKALELATHVKQVYYMRDMNKTLANTYKMMGRFDSAYFYQLGFQHLQDSISNLDRAREIAQLEAQQRVHKKEQENAQLSALNQVQILQINQRNILLISSGVVLLILLLLGGLLYRANRSNKELLHAVQSQNQKLDLQNAQLNEKLNEQDSLFNIVTHDIRGPLANVIQLLDIEQHESDPQEKVKMRELVAISAKNAMDFIEDFDTIQAYENRTEKPPISSFDLAELVTSLLEDFRSSINDKNIQIHFDPSKKLEVQSVKEYVKHIAYNILSNAIKYSPKGGSLFISLVAGDVPRISIEDQGPGIDARLHERIFERFYRGEHPTNQSDYRSSGLGLAVTKLLVEKIGGRIKLNSAPGKGSEFIIYLG